MTGVSHEIGQLRLRQAAVRETKSRTRAENIQDICFYQGTEKSRKLLRLWYAKSVVMFLGGIITNSVDPQPTQGKNLCNDLFPVQYTESKH